MRRTASSLTNGRSVRGREHTARDLMARIMRHVAARKTVRLGLRREAGLITFYLGVGLRQKVDAAHIGELDQVYEHVGSFIGDPGTRSRILQVVTDFRIINPLQLCPEFAHFGSQGQRQVTDRVPSSPATGRSKATQTITEDIELARHGQILAPWILSRAVVLPEPAMPPLYRRQVPWWCPVLGAKRSGQPVAGRVTPRASAGRGGTAGSPGRPICGWCGRCSRNIRRR